jgi:hypothetical protein
MSSTSFPTPERQSTATEPTLVVVLVGDRSELERQFSRLNAQGAEAQKALGCSLRAARARNKALGHLTLNEIIRRARRVTVRQPTGISVAHRQRSARSPRRSRRSAAGARTGSSPARESGSDADPDPEPEPLRTCRGCGKEFEPTRANQTHHNGACKQAAYRERKRRRDAVDLPALRERQRVVLPLVRRGEVHPLDALRAVVWPETLLERAA